MCVIELIGRRGNPQVSEAKTVYTKAAAALGCCDRLWSGPHGEWRWNLRMTWAGSWNRTSAGAGTSEERCSGGRKARPIQPNFYCQWMRKAFLCCDPGKMPEFPADLEYRWVWEVPTWNTDTFSQFQSDITQGNSALLLQCLRQCL